MIRKELFLIAYLVGLVFSFSGSGVKATAFQLIATKDDYNSKLEGEWTVSTKVIWSESKYVQIGAESESEISIANINGNLYPNWKAGDWKLKQNTAIDFSSDNSLHWERESFLNDGDKYWHVQSINKFSFDKDGVFTGLSHHKQYLNGEYIGAYVTQSILTKKHEYKISKI